MGVTKVKIILKQEERQETKSKLRVCAYCRVSSKSEEQLLSYETQVAVYTERIQRELGWEPRYTFEEGIAETIEWYCSHPEWLERVLNGEYLSYYAKMYDNR